MDKYKGTLDTIKDIFSLRFEEFDIKVESERYDVSIQLSKDGEHIVSCVTDFLKLINFEKEIESLVEQVSAWLELHKREFENFEN